MENNWTEICAKCMEGDIEPRYCEYYGEPNGCNSPTCGEHPPTPTPTPNAVAMHSCLVKILVEMTDLGGMQVGKKACFSPDAIADEIRQALAVPPRNCDVGTAEEQKFRHSEYCKKSSMGKGCSQCPLKDTLDCRFDWMQMPYQEGGAK